MYQALYRKWRPRTFDDVVGQSHITDTLKRQVAAGRLSHAYLFTGTRGTGKTSCAKILARAVNCEHPVEGNPCNQCPSCLGIENGSILDVLELDAASNNGVDQVRALRDEAVYTPAAVRRRVYIVDEVHMLSTAAFNALLKILEEPPAHLMFILATTELHKVPATIKSRCQQFAFKRILPSDITQRLGYVAQQEGMELTQEGAQLLARLADGGLRDALSLLDQCTNPTGVVGEAEVLSALGLAGNVETAALMERIAGGDTAGALETLGRLYAAGKDVGALLGELASLTRDLLVRKTAPQGGAALLTGGYEERVMGQLGGRLAAPRLMQMLELLQSTLADLSRSSNRRTDAELCLIKLCDTTLDHSPSGLSARLARLEGMISGGGAEWPARPEPAPVSPALAAEPATPAPAERAPAPAQAEKSDSQKAEPQKAKAPPARPGGDLWPRLAEALRGQVPMSVYPFLSNPAMVQGQLEDERLILWVDSEFTRDLVGKAAVVEAVKRTAEGLLGQSVGCTVSVGRPPEAAPVPGQALASQTRPAAEHPGEPAHDKLKDLAARGARFDNIIVQA
ncbi:DNA polymerase III subunit gamma/tau [Pseudoflavonifractor sp. 524-17]|uniref:DNA polymerase III subunit gamma/tau n=1 Tax=Pseudoflavonifractor sp. 524-17 TaxID=2304577 RepID=UPI00137AE0B3|nr:DNA polymerase III subunit gamma/tau [Pseudoflavonifractor sp. 524-17]NCE64917.1 DNA polymerase III subunit gamma/tau [Pseudoflavonifractor sp. 524-17]